MKQKHHFVKDHEATLLILDAIVLVTREEVNSRDADVIFNTHWKGWCSSYFSNLTDGAFQNVLRTLFFINFLFHNKPLSQGLLYKYFSNFPRVNNETQSIVNRFCQPSPFPLDVCGVVNTLCFSQILSIYLIADRMLFLMFC